MGDTHHRQGEGFQNDRRLEGALIGGSDRCQVGVHRLGTDLPQPGTRRISSLSAHDQVAGNDHNWGLGLGLGRMQFKRPRPPDPMSHPNINVELIGKVIFFYFSKGLLFLHVSFLVCAEMLKWRNTFFSLFLLLCYLRCSLQYQYQLRVIERMATMPRLALSSYVTSSNF